MKAQKEELQASLFLGLGGERNREEEISRYRG